MTATIFVGVGKRQGSSPDVRTHGFFRRRYGKTDWQSLTSGLPANPEVRGIVLHPDVPGIVFAGIHKGIYRIDDGLVLPC